ncbi:MAG TPA: hypothetical protein VFB42_14360 [Gaiellaceae bacterium]|nr:hypothetical protein [Gaiellaceae bacterium]
MTNFIEQLEGCTVESLDGYLRGLGFFLLAGEVEPSVRGWWNDDGNLCIASTRELAELSLSVVERVRSDPAPLRTPWRGKDGRDRAFVGTRNEATERELDWFDACALPRVAEAQQRESAGRERSDRENNPLLGQGGSFGRSDPQAAYDNAIAILRAAKVDSSHLAGALVAMLRGQPLEARLARHLSTGKAVLGAYQSGRGTGAGASIRDVAPTRQAARSSVWDVVTVLTGLRLFRGGSTRRPDPRARLQASFPFLVQSVPIGAGPAGVHELRVDDQQTFEFLAPLWSSPCTPRVLRHLISSARLRHRSGTARNTLDAVLVQASRAGHGLGFDRLARFALVPGSDPRYRFAVRRGEVHALSLRGAYRAADEIVPFLRELDRAVRDLPPALAAGKRRLESSLAAFGRKPADTPSLADAESARVQTALLALALLQTPAARAAPALPTARLSPEWLRLADDGSLEYRLARSLVGGLTRPGGASLVRESILPHREDSPGRFVLDPDRRPPRLDRAADPLGTLAELALASLRRNRDENVAREGSCRFDDLAVLVAGGLGREGERRVALLCAALAGIAPPTPLSAPPRDPVAVGIGSLLARLLLAAQQAQDEGSVRPGLERAERLASLLLAGQVERASVAADRELRRRGLDLLPLPPLGAHRLRPASLALAVLLPFDRQAHAALERVVSRTPVPPQEGSTT